MRKVILISMGMIFFLAVGIYLEKASFFERIREYAREKSIPMGFFDYGYGALGRILKKLSVIRVIPEDDQFDPIKAAKNSALMKINVQTEGEERFQVYWADESHQYDEGRSNTIFLRMSENDYYLNLADLKTIRWLRIDPTDNPSKVLIKEISIEQEGYGLIQFKTNGDFKKIIPLNDIREISYGSEGVTVVTSGNDAHFEISIEARVSKEADNKLINESIFSKKRRLSENLYTVNPGRAEEFPSSRLVSNELIQKNVPILSVATEEDSLHGDRRGIIQNWWQKGQDWERLAYVSYYENGKLQFATSAGLRLHGGSTRKAGINFRLYFRKKYGMKEIEPGMIFGSNTQPIKRLVISSDRSSPRFNQSIALAIARKVGCLTPEIKPVYFLLNGKPPLDIAYFIIEYLNKKQWINHIGHEDFIFLRLRTQNNIPDDQKRYDQLEEKIRQKKRLTMDEVQKDIDIENLSRFIIATVFCGNWDNVQGAAILNKKSVDPKWFWVMWDMDVSFLDLKRSGIRGEFWKERGFSITLQQEFRMTIFRRLMEECPIYRKYFLRLFMEILNHRITKPFLLSQIEKYEILSQAMFDSKPYFNSQTMREFMENRSNFLRNDFKKYYGDKFPIKESVPCTVNGPPKIIYQIDGYLEKPGYQGWYFKGRTIDIQIEKPFKNHFSHWIVNGEKKADEHLIIPVDGEMVIEPSFN